MNITNRTVAGSSYTRNLCVCARLDILKFDKKSTDLQCFIVKFGGLGKLFGGG